MRTKHVAFLVPGAHGHINPTLGIAFELLARGYRVTYATDEGPLAALLRDLHFDVVAHDPTVCHEGFSSAEERMTFLRKFDASQYVHSRLESLNWFTRNPPSLLFHDSSERALAALISSRISDLPAIQSSPSFVYNETFTAANGGQDFPKDVSSKVDAGTSITLPAILSTHGVNVAALHEPPPCTVVFIPRFFQCAGDTFDHRYFFVGPSLTKRPHYGHWAHPNNDRKIVLISQGTVINADLQFFRACISALRHLNLHLVISVGRGVDIAALQPIPENVEIYPFVAHLDVLPYASAYIGHGGMTSTMEALWHGVPLLLSPQDRHQAAIADRVSCLQLGRTLSAVVVSPDTLKDQLRSLFEDMALVNRVKRVSAELKSHDAVREVVSMIEERARPITTLPVR